MSSKRGKPPSGLVLDGTRPQNLACSLARLRLIYLQLLIDLFFQFQLITAVKNSYSSVSLPFRPWYTYFLSLSKQKTQQHILVAVEFVFIIIPKTDLRRKTNSYVKIEGLQTKLLYYIIHSLNILMSLKKYKYI